MTDIVERLRRWGGPTRPYGSISDTCDQAAAEIERLRAALRQIASIDPWDDGEQGYVDKARAALGEQP